MMSARCVHFKTTVFAVALTLVGSAGAHVDLFAPDGGEQFHAGSMTEIAWQVAAQHNTLNWDVWYSTDGPDGPWIEIAVDLPAGDISEGAIHTFLWFVPDTPGPGWVRVRQDNAGDDYEDVSQQPFDMLPNCVWDLDGDGVVGVPDLLGLLGAWGDTNVPADFDGGGVGSTDLLALLGNWGGCS